MDIVQCERGNDLVAFSILEIFFNSVIFCEYRYQFLH